MGRELDMGGQPLFLDAACDRGNYDSSAILVSYIILDHKDRASAVLLTALDRAQICIEHIASLDFSGTIIHKDTSYRRFVLTQSPHYHYAYVGPTADDKYSAYPYRSVSVVILRRGGNTAFGIGRSSL